MTIPLLATKLYIPPIRHKLVSRPRLIERLNEGLRQNQGLRQNPGFGRKLTLISAPAGFGKTTLVSEWISKGLDKIAWLSLDEGDNDPSRFLAYLIAALQAVETNVGKGALSALQSPQPPPSEAILTSLINELAALPDRLVLVLDDYHLIEAPSIHQTLAFLLEHLPPQMHLVIATREDPHLPLARLRVRGQLTELRAADLRFSSSEAAEFLNQVMGLGLAADDIAALENRTEGWIAGLQLAALALQGLALQGTISMQGHKDATGFIKSFTGSHHFVLDYLIEEVLEQQSASVQTFLLQTAVLDQLTASLCDALTGQDNGQATLEMLQHANLFIIPLDEERRWYRYHHLFADLLRQRLHQAQPERLPIQHRRASEWYEQNGFADEAIEYALHAREFERAAYLIEDHLDGNYERASQMTLWRWLAEMPREFIFSKPYLCILYAWNLFTGGQLDAAAQSLQAAEKLLEPNTDQELVASLDQEELSDTDRNKLLGRIAAIRSFLASYNGDSPGTIQYAHQALEVLSEQELPWRSAASIALGDAYASQGQMVAAHKARSDALTAGKASGDAYILMMANLRLAEILRQQGKLKQVIDICERQFKRADENGMSESAIVGWLLGIWGEVLAESNELDGAIDRAKKGAKLTARSGDVLYQVWSNLCLVRVLFSSGDITGTQDVIQAIENNVREYDVPLWALHQLSAWRMRIWLAQGKLEVASQWVGERKLDPDGEPTYLHEMEYIVFARILIAQGQLDEADRLLQRLIETAKAGGRHSSTIELLMLKALAAQSRDDTDQAISTLEQALALAEVDGFIRIFVDEGPPMVRLLYKALSRGISPDYVRRLLAAFPNPELERAGASQTQDPEFEWLEPLSKRELEVLQLITEGLTNQEIATRLYIALNTVKVHTRNINSKLGVISRMQATARARALGILPST